MAKKKGIGLTLDTNQSSVTRNSKSRIASQKVVPTILTIIEEQFERWNISLDQRGYNLHPATGAYSSCYYSTSAVLPGVPDCLPSGDTSSGPESLR